MNDEFDIAGTISLLIIAFALAVEATLLVLAFVGSDRVECTVLWCTFTTERTTTTSTITSTRECFMNGERVDCGTFGAEGFTRPTQNGSLCWKGETWGCG